MEDLLPLAIVANFGALVLHKNLSVMANPTTRWGVENT